MRINGISINAALWSGLRNCQQESVSVGLKYLTNPISGKSCLISLPTGAGKSGVICILSHISKHKRVLILCHRRAVCDQLITQLSGAFFCLVAPEQNIFSKDVFSSVDDSKSCGIYVSTFQKLQSMDKEALHVLKENVDLLIVDEGHSEPAPSWSELVRGINGHKIIVTATPYRNDLFQFDIDPENNYIYTFTQALKDSVLVDPSFSLIEEVDLSGSVGDFFKQSPNGKCIVKCKTFVDVNNFVGIFSKDYRTLGVHEQFANDGRENVKVSVPKSIAGSDWQVIVHQKKLDEGVDIPEAKLLVLTYPVASGRELVQTVGRVVRLYGNESAKVFELENDSNHRMWKNYLDFDIYLRGNSRKFLMSLNTAGLIESYLEAFPDVSYFDSGYKKKFDFKSFDVTTSLNVPLASVCFIKKVEGFTVEALIDSIGWELNRKGALTNQQETDLGVNVLLSVSFENSKLLKDQLFFEPSLDVFIVKDLGEYVAILDSGGKDHSFKGKLHLGASVDVDKLLNLANRSKRTRTKEAHTRSIGTSLHRAEGVSLKSDELERLVTSQGNSSYALTTLKVDNLNKDNKKDSSYYLGMNSGRVSDQKKRNFSLKEICCWMDDVGGALNSTKYLESQFISSYAKAIKEVPADNPINVMIDFSGIESELYLVCGDKQIFIDNNFKFFDMEDDGVQLDDEGRLVLQLNYDKREERLVFSSSESVVYADSYENAEREGASDFVKRLNALPFTVFYSDGLSYADGRFYRISLPTDVVKCFSESKLSGKIVGLSDLLGVNLEEKDIDNTSADDFGDVSIFHLIDRLRNISDMASTPKDMGVFYTGISDVDLVLCSDMGTEPADFILSSPTKLVFVHVKCGKTNNPQSSAGALAEVGGQAVKNLAHLISHDGELLPGNMGNLRSKWPSSNADESLERLRLFKGDRFENANDDEALRKDSLDEAIGVIVARRRSAAVKKELWVVVGNAFSKADFEQQLSKGNRGRGESLQAYQLLDGWVSTCANVDVDFKLFVSP